jgi:ribonuclease P protein component
VPQETFGKSKRMLTRQTFQKVFDRASHRIANRYFLILARPNEAGCARLGLVIGKKNIHLAVDRNRVKRIVRESFRRHQGNLPAFDVIFVARRGLNEADKNIAVTLAEAWVQLSRDTDQVQVNGC